MTRVTKAFYKKEYEEPSAFESKPLASGKRHRFNSSKKQLDDTNDFARNTGNAYKKPKCMSLDKREREKERRRLRRSKQNNFQERNSGNSKTTCFGCRKTGHSIRNCPSMGKNTNSLVSGIPDICYKCASTSHTSSKCKVKTDPDNPYPYASCFICKKKGHISGACPENEHGLYLYGGSCKHCESVRHLAKDCPIALQLNAANSNTATEKSNIQLGTLSVEQGGDDDDYNIALKKKATSTTVSKNNKKAGGSKGKKNIVF